MVICRSISKSRVLCWFPYEQCKLELCITTVWLGSVIFSKHNRQFARVANISLGSWRSYNSKKLALSVKLIGL